MREGVVVMGIGDGVAVGLMRLRIWARVVSSIVERSMIGAVCVVVGDRRFCGLGVYGMR